MERAEKIRQAGTVAHVVAIAVDDLAQEGNLLDALVYQRANLRGDLSNGARPLLTPAVGDNAKGADVVAPVNDRHVRADERAPFVSRQDKIGLGRLGAGCAGIDIQPQIPPRSFAIL